MARRKIQLKVIAVLLAVKTKSSKPTSKVTAKSLARATSLTLKSTKDFILRKEKVSQMSILR